VRFLKFILRFVGWLLTPLVAWAASFFGAWLMALAAPTFDDSSIGLILAVAGGAVGAISATVLWMRLLRRSPELREVLQVTEEGIPAAAVEEPQDEAGRRDQDEDGRRETKTAEGGQL
jgi:HAMP domain-containing protein